MNRFVDQSNASPFCGLVGLRGAPALRVTRVQRNGLEALGASDLALFDAFAFALDLPEIQRTLEGRAMVVDSVWDPEKNAYRITMLFTELTRDASQALDRIVFASRN